MTTHDDLHDLETRLRASLRDRAGDVETTPALYERVQRQASRGTWVRRGFALAGAVAAIGVAVAVVPSLLPDPTPFDVVDTPEESLPSDTPTAAEDSEPAVPVDEPDVSDPFALRGLAVAEVRADGTTEIRTGTRTIRSDVGVVSLAAAPLGDWVVAGLEDGSIGGINLGDTGGTFDEVIDATANGGAVLPSPLGDGVAWIEGTDLHVLPLADGSAVRVLPLEGDVPDDLRIEQWFAGADAQVILASAPGGGLWSLPMDDSDVFNSAPTDPAFVLADDAVDGAILDDLTRIELALDQAGTGVVLRRDGDPSTEVATGLPAGTDVALTTDGQRVVLHHRGTGVGELYDDASVIGVAPPDFNWDGDSLLAVAPLPIIDQDVAEATEVGPTGDASALGLRTDAPLVGTDGIDLVIRDADGTEDRRTVYRPAAESEAVLGELAVRPGSTATDGLVALESFSEGETSVRFAKLDDDEANPVGAIIVASGDVTGLVWSEDGTHVAWSDPDGLWAARVEGDGEQVGPRQFLAEGSNPVADWVDVSAESTWFSLFDGSGMVSYVSRAATGRLTIDEVVEREGQVWIFDTHINPGAAVGPEVIADVTSDRVELRWAGDGEMFGRLPAVVASDATIEVSGPQVIVMGSDRHVLVTFDGDVVELPVLTDWDVLD